MGKFQKTSLLGFIISIWTSCLCGQSAVETLYLRNDLAPLVKQLACTAKKINPVKLMFHIGEPLDIRLIAKKAQSSNNELMALAKSLAKINFHHGFFFGQCAFNQDFIGSVPAPFAFNQKNVRAVMDSYCRKLSIDYARLDGGISQKKRLDNAIASYTCYPISSNKHGPLLWYAKLIQKKQDLPPIPERQGEILNERDFFAWINRVRKKEGMKALLVGEELLQEETRKLASFLGVGHNRVVINEVSHRLWLAGYQFLGENRALAENFQELASLFWFSPRHRDLLLDQKAETLALYQKPLAGASFYVALVAKRRS